MIFSDVDRWMIGVIITSIFALSGWGKVYLDHRSSKPKISGRIISCMRGGFSINGRNFSSFIIYPYLYNVRKNSMNIYDYRLSVEIEGVWIALDSVFSLEFSDFVTFGTEGEENIDVQDFRENLLYRKNPEVQNGVAVHGWLPFCGAPDLNGKEVTRYKLTCIDATLKKHKITTKKSDMNQALLNRFANIRTGVMILFDQK